MTTADVNSITGLYVTYYGRAADRSGLDYWVGQGRANVSLETIATNFAVAAETIAKYPYLATPNVSDPTAFVTSIYANAFGRQPDAAGLAFWVNRLRTGGAAQAPTFILTVLLNAQGTDFTALQNKANAATRFTNGLITNNIVGTTQIFTDSTTILNTVDQTPTSVTAGNTSIDARIAVYTSAGTAGTSTALTSSLLDNLVGTANNDTFIGANTGTPATDLVQATDRIDGGAGVDIFQYSGATGTAAAPAAVPTLVNVERVELLSPANGTTIDFTGKATGLQQVTLKGSTLNAGSFFTVKGLSGITLAAEGNAITTAGGSPTTTVTSLTADFGSTASGTVSIKDAVFTTLDISGSTAVTTLNIAADGLGNNSIGTLTAAAAVTTLNVSGAGKLTIGNGTTTGAPAAVTTINASTNTGGVNILSQAAAGTKVTITGGGGNDTLTGGADADIITGGAGNDIITGGAGADTISGGAGNDIITGGAGDDRITGGAGADVLTGGLLAADADTFVYTALTDSSAATLTGLSTSLSFDTITDFATTVDKIDISGIAGYTSAKWAGDVSTTLSAGISFGDALTALTGTGGRLALSGSSGYFKLGTTTYIVGSDGIANTSGGVGNDLLIALTGTTPPLAPTPLAPTPVVGDFTFASV